ncbi:TRAP transporter large permease [Acuticoccus kandeliae]|uniref:TRAP transporter large permease n=1 Tax=Acuticoccus kandeliae TaxID=2073160 RepID=UPI000D3E94EC|nr:TRAP transporter large permease [Acuticoccus kandeliae]
MLGSMIGLMLGGFALSLPIAVALGLAALAGMLLFTTLPPLIFAQQLFTALDKFALVAVPLFILAGNLMQAGGISRRFMDVAQALVGNIRGGMGATCVITCMIFAAVSGSGVATTFAVGAILIPALVRGGYPVPFAAALQATSAELGVIIPPSIPLILYAVSAEVSVGDLFIAGLGPGFLIGGALIVTVLIWAHFRRDTLVTPDDGLPLLAALRRASASLLTPVIILGGIYGGVFTPTEAAAVAVFYALFVGMVVHRELKPSDLPDVLRRSLRSSASIMLIISTAGVFSYLINRAGIPATIGEWLATNMDSPAMFLLGINIALFIIGMFLETSASIIILTPILVPVAIHFGIDPVQFGIIAVVNLALGLITPPFGVNLFAACQVAGTTVQSIIRPILMFVCVLIVCLMIITYVPAISLFLIR